ncbi:MAG: putative molybdenum carrier protein [Planctomycetaceae bacterium]
MSRQQIAHVVEGIVSGGQTGVDRAALDFALDRGIPCGGWCPDGRRAEDGRIPDRYPLRQTHDIDYAQRTEFNVRDSDGTLILARGKLKGGTSLTATRARRMKKPLLVVDLDFVPDFASIRDWIAVNEIRVLNIAGPRESQTPGIGDRTTAFLAELFPG